MSDLSLTPEEIEFVRALDGSRREESAKWTALSALVLETVRGGVWHTTNFARYQSIVQSRSILPEPPLSDSERWGTREGPKGYPYVRTLGGISLFDFRDFDPESYSVTYPVSQWQTFVPYRSKWKEAVWIEIDLSRLKTGFISGADLLARHKVGSAFPNLMPLIEGAHIGPLPITAFKRVFAVREGCDSLIPLESDGTS